jgi:hypothetical protein
VRPSVVPVTAEDVAAVHRRVAAHVRQTPVLHVEPAELGLSGEGLRPPLVAKLDLLQPTGSFKVRGAVALLTDPSLRDRLRTAGVIAASGGNFGLAVAWAASRLGVAATVVVPASSPRAKLDPIATLGAELVVVDGVYADAFAVAEHRRAASGAVLAHAYDQREVVAGQGTSAWELLASVGELDTLLVACGGGGLLAGTIAAVGAGCGSWRSRPTAPPPSMPRWRPDGPSTSRSPALQRRRWAPGGSATMRGRCATSSPAPCWSVTPRWRRLSAGCGRRPGSWPNRAERSLWPP